MKKLLMLLVLFLVSPAFAADYTVKTSGGNYNTIQGCINAVGAGDRCIVDPGTWSEALTFSASGSSGSPITIVAATLDDQANHVITGRINFTDESYIVLEGFELQTGLGCNGCSYITVKDNLFTNTDIMIGGSGGSCGDADFLCGDNMLFDGNIDGATNRGDDIFKVNGTKWVMRGTIVQGITNSTEHIDFTQYPCYTGYPDLSYSLVENNLYTDILDDVPNDGQHHFWLANCTSGLLTNHIVRYNKVRNIQTHSFASNTESGGTIEDIFVYNNSMSDMARGTTTADANITMGAVGGYAGAQNNIYEDSLDYANARGASGGDNCDGSLVYDPDHTVSLVNGDCLDNGTGVIINDNPDFTDVANDDFSLQSDSPARDAGYHLTTANGAGLNSTSLTVFQPGYFQDGWAGVNPDCIAIGTVSNTACIVAGSVNYSTGAMTLDTALTWSDSANVWLYKRSDGEIVLKGSAPDIGAEEYDVASPTVWYQMSVGSFGGSFQ